MEEKITSSQKRHQDEVQKMLDTFMGSYEASLTMNIDFQPASTKEELDILNQNLMSHVKRRAVVSFVLISMLEVNLKLS